ncbi:MAG: coproporphyrinogen dehydrogenase HemZ [Eubacteriales bacterium]|nr:coproporphyrinogen dehydrogenase HemZ [Eubacteriales bacterium]
MNLICSNEKFNDELLLVVKLFFSPTEVEESDLNIKVDYNILDNNLSYDISISGIFNKSIHNDKILTKQQLEKEDKYVKRYLKISLYDMLSQLTQKTMPWGSLTGIRPTKLFYELKKELGSSILAKNELINTFRVSPQKAEVVMEVTRNQSRIEINDNLVDLYINIPFCTTKCYYCSFISAPIAQCQQYVEPYIDALLKELNAVKQIINKNNYIVKSIYMGGGTPTALSHEQLDRILTQITYPVSEFTVEAGRPDTITKEKLDVLKKHGVTRISINPQTFSNRTLKQIGRAHTSQDIIDAYNMALPYDFSINMDLIAGLSNESFNTFKNSLNKTLELHPDNITVHTLSVKRTSKLSEGEGDKGTVDEVTKMIDYSYKKLTEAGYSPYYLYKQKNMVGNLENLGYTLKNKECIFNIDSMEEVATIVAVGANAISKRFFSLTNRIERNANVKNLNDYISRIDEIISKKQEFFK